jgi:hypothetical protein
MEVESIFKAVGEALLDLNEMGVARIESTDDWDYQDVLHHVKRVIEDEKGAYKVTKDENYEAVVIEFI